MLLFHSSDLTTIEMTKLSRLVSYILSVYLPSFLMTQLKPHACEGPFVTLFQRDLRLAFEAVDSDMCKVVNRYFLQHAKSWLLPHNITLSVCFENPPMTKEVLTSLTSLPEEVEIEDLLLTRQAKLKRLFTISSKTAPCISFGSTEFWKSTENHSLCNKKEIGELKHLMHRKKIRDNSSRRNQTDVRQRSCLCSSSG